MPLQMEQILTQGGWILKVLLGLSLVGGAIAVVCSLRLLRVRRDKGKIAAFINSRSPSEASLRAELDLFLLDLQSGYVFLQIIASIAPLLGLLGTVLGLMESFAAIAHLGLQEPSVFATGISKALLTTIAGLIVAIPHLIVTQLLERKTDVYCAELDCQIQALRSEPVS